MAKSERPMVTEEGPKNPKPKARSPKTRDSCRAGFQARRILSRMPRTTKRGHHSVYVVYLRNPNGDGKAGYYVGMTGLKPEARFQNHKNGIKAAHVVRRYGERLVPKLYAHLNPMP